MSSNRHDRSRGDGARLASILVGAAVLFIIGWMAYEAGLPRPRAPKAAVEADASTPTATSEPASVSPDAGADSVNAGEDLDAGLFLPSLSLGDAGVMPAGAPRSVKLGVVLVSFAGAEGAPPTARSKPDALALAERLGGDARSDFHRAVTSGDPGSADDIGRLPRGVLDPRTEIAVFALAPGEISEVLETPRGYWIVKRID